MSYRRIYLLLLIAGAAVPYYFFLSFIAADGLNPTAFLAGLFANGAAAGFTADLLISSLVFWVAMWQQYATGKGPAPWAFVAVNLLVGLSMALPLYLYLRHRAIAVA